MATKIELELSDELQARLEKVATHMALSSSEAAKFILAQHLTSERSFDLMELINKGREVVTRIMQETK